MDELLNARPGTHSRASSWNSGDNGVDRGINFTMFLTMMSERLFEFDTEAELIEAFESFDENDTGTVKVEEMRKWMSEMGERMDTQEVSVGQGKRQLLRCLQIDKFLKGPFTDRQGNFNYREWVKMLRINDEDETKQASTL